MFRRISTKFYAIVIILIILFAGSYGILSFYLHEQNMLASKMLKTSHIEREIRFLNSLFYEIRFWEKKVLEDEDPKAIAKLGKLIALVNNKLDSIQGKGINKSVQSELIHIKDGILIYEDLFNHIFQLKTTQNLHRTTIDTGYKSLISNILNNNMEQFLKPLFNLTQFYISYLTNQQESVYHALILVSDYLEKKIEQAYLSDERTKEYLISFKHLIKEDYALVMETYKAKLQFDTVSSDLLRQFDIVLLESTKLFKANFAEAEAKRIRMNKRSLFATILSIAILLFIFFFFSKSIVSPIRSIAKVMREVRTGNVESRFDFTKNKKDELIQFGYYFNAMLDSLQKSEENYRFLIENQIDLVVKVDPTGRFQFISQSYCELFDKTEAELIGKKSMPFPHSDDQAHSGKAMEALNQPPFTSYIEQRAMTKNGWRWLAWNNTAIVDDNDEIVSIIGVGRDITEKKDFESALKTSQETFLSVLDGINATIYVSDLNSYEILFVNQYMKETFKTDLIGQTCWEVFRNNSGPCSHCTNKKLLNKNGEPTGVHIWDDLNPITNRWYINQDRAIKWTDGRYVHLQIATDITDLKSMENELRHAHKMESIGTIAGGIAHDFNNILSIILGNTELALDDTPDWSPSHKNIKEIKTASLRAKDVISQLLSFSRKSEQEQKPLNMLEMVRESLKLIRSSIPSSVEITKKLPATCDPIFANATQIHQILINLCTNAAQAMAENGGVLEVSVNKLVLNNTAIDKFKNLTPGSYLELIVKDTGSGINHATQEKIFDPYFTTKETGKGTGMGLAVVHGIVKNHNGHIFVDSEPDKGTSFTIIFPTIDKYQKKETLKRITKNPTGKETILFVDDEESIVDICKTFLGKLGYNVEAYSDPNKALKRFAENPNYFDLLISDMTMPQMSGVKLSEKIKKIKSNLPIIICTGHSSMIDEEKTKQLGIEGYIMKPATMTVFAESIRQVLDR